MKKKLLSIGLLLSVVSAQANPLKNMFTLAGKSMETVAQTAANPVVEVVATPVVVQNAEEIALALQLDAAEALAKQAAISQAEYAAKIAAEAAAADMSVEAYKKAVRTAFNTPVATENGILASIKRAGSFVTTTAKAGYNKTLSAGSTAVTASKNFVAAHPTGTKVAAGVTAAALLGYVAYKLGAVSYIKSKFAKTPVDQTPANDQTPQAPVVNALDAEVAALKAEAARLGFGNLSSVSTDCVPGFSDAAYKAAGFYGC